MITRKRKCPSWFWNSQTNPDVERKFSPRQFSMKGFRKYVGKYVSERSVIRTTLDIQEKAKECHVRHSRYEADAGHMEGHMEGPCNTPHLRGDGESAAALLSLPRRGRGEHTWKQKKKTSKGNNFVQLKQRKENCNQPECFK